MISWQCNNLQLCQFRMVPDLIPELAMSVGILIMSACVRPFDHDLLENKLDDYTFTNESNMDTTWRWVLIKPFEHERNTCNQLTDEWTIVDIALFEQAFNYSENCVYS